MSAENNMEMFVDQCADLIEANQDRVTEMLENQGLSVEDAEVGEPFLRYTMRMLRESQLILSLYVTLANAGVIDKAYIPVAVPLLLSCSQLHMNMYLRLFERVMGLDEEDLDYTGTEDHRLDDLEKAITQIKQQLGIEN